ncbi:MAG TPA: hypothetical protein VFC78_04150 [Tepidisphaeraceae bacterium]|nr:hypothetical protein [Tepidisphaeraceae bacterium]
MSINAAYPACSLHERFVYVATNRNVVLFTLAGPGAGALADAELRMGFVLSDLWGAWRL